MDEELDAVDSFEKKQTQKKKKFKNIDEKIADCLDPTFNDRESASIKSFAVKKRSEIKVTTRCMSGKLFMFAKLSLSRVSSTKLLTYFAFLMKILKKFTKST